MTQLSVLVKLLDESDLLQELLSNNSVLLEFLRDDRVLSILFDLVINEGQLKDVEENISKGLEKLDLVADEAEPKAKVSDDDKEDTLRPVEKDDKSEKLEQEKLQEKTPIVDEVEAEESGSAESGEESDKQSEEEEEEDDDDETEEEKHSRHATLATEILSADVWSLTDTVMESTENLNKLWAILDTKDQLSINLSTYFMKIMEHLLDMKCDEMITYLVENQPRLVEKFMNHLSNPPLMDFLLKLISTDKPDNSTGIIDFLQQQDLILYLIDALDPDDENSINDVALVRQSSAADFLKALITISANSTTDNSTIGPNELTRELVCYECMDKLCNIMLKGGYALANGVGIIIEIIRKNNSDYDILPILLITLESHPPTGRDPIYLGYLLQVFSEKIADFNDLLLSDRESKVTPNSLQTPFGEIEPLGFERFKICELIAELLHCSNMALLNDNRGYDAVKDRNDLRQKMKQFDPISFKYNEVIVLPNGDGDEGREDRKNGSDDDFANDTIDSFNSKHDNEDSILHNQNFDQDIEEPHENANLTEEQLRANPVIGDVWKIALFDTQIVTNIVSMFYKFPWNNFLHNVVFDIVQQVLNGSMDIGFNKFLAVDLFDRGDITHKIITGQTLCNDFEDENNGLRLGYMGHLTLIAEEVVKFIQSYPTNTLSELIDQKISESSWEEYVSNVLYDTREKYNAILGAEDDEDEEDDNISNTFDEGTGEVIEESDYKSGFLFDNNDPYEHQDNKDEDYDEEATDDRDIYDDDNYKAKQLTNTIKSSSDESESEDEDDHFSKYMSQELVNTASTEVLNSVGNKNSDEEVSSDEDSGSSSNEKGSHDAMDEDEYIDPNDDGQSYKKFNPLYDDTGSLRGEKEPDEPSDNSDSSSDEDDDKYNEKESTKLTRAASKG